MKYEMRFGWITGKNFQSLMENIKNVESIPYREDLEKVLLKLGLPYQSPQIVEKVFSENLSLSESYEKHVITNMELDELGLRRRTAELGRKRY